MPALRCVAMHGFPAAPLCAGLLTLGMLAALGAAAPASGAPDGGRVAFVGHVTDTTGAPVSGAMVTFGLGDPGHERTVFSAEDGRFRAPVLGPGAHRLRVRRIGWRDHRSADHPPPATGAATLDVVLEPETDPAQLAAQLPANRWYALVLERLPDPAQREELVRQCTYCHQQGSAATRRQREPEEWEKVLALMARMGGLLSSELREKVPALFNEAYDPARAVPRLTREMHEPHFAPPPPADVRRALVEEWELGPRGGMQHDVALHPDGRLYSVDMMQDRLYRLDPRAPDGARESFEIPRGDLPLGGVFGTRGGAPLPPNANAHVGPHSLQVAPDGSIWTTLALGNQLARFDPVTERWSLHALEAGFYPHTLRFDARGRIWYTLAASNHVGRFDPASGEHRSLRLPAPGWGQAVVLRLLPAILWFGRHVDLAGLADSGGGMTLPVPYGIDVAPDGSVWFSQLNAHRIGRIDAETLALEMIDTPFPGPRRLRFDSRGRLWIPSFSGGLVARFDPASREFRSWKLPVPPEGTETPYALNVDLRSDTVWICGTNSDSLLRFEPEAERFTVYPLPTRVTFTREIDFDDRGRVWTSNSNLPAWQIEYGTPRVIRLDPEGGAAALIAGVHAP